MRYFKKENCNSWKGSMILLYFYENYNNLEKMFDSIYNINHTSYYISSKERLVEVLESEKDKVNKTYCDFILFFRFDISFLKIKKTCEFLIRNGIHNFKIFNENDFHFLFVKFFRQYFECKGIDVNCEKLEINNCTFPNTLRLENDIIDNNIEFGDIILPAFFNDYSMLTEGPYEYENVVLKRNDVVIDCGANIGSFSALALNKQCTVHAFEPITSTFLLLKKNIQYCKCKKIHLNNIGLSNEEKYIDFFIKNDSGNNSYILSDKMIRKERIKVTTIDKYVKENNLTKVDFIKADVEGAERDILIGAMDTLKTYTPKLSFCTYHLDDDPFVLEEMIRKASDKYIIMHKWDKIFAYTD